MKKQLGFWGDLEIYTWKMVGRVSPALPYLAMAIIGVVIISSQRAMRGSVASAHDLGEAVERAARVGDYERARKLLNYYNIKPLNDLEELAYPERVVEQEIEKYEELLLTYPGSRDIYLVLSQLYAEIGNDERAAEYWESARILDPNNEIFAGE